MSDRQEFSFDFSESIESDQESGRRSSSGKKFGFLLHLTDTPTRVHFSLPEKPYIHPKTHAKFAYRTGMHHYFPFGGKAGKGSFMECAHFTGGECVSCAYANPGLYNLNVEPDTKLKEFNPMVYYAVSGWIEEEFHLMDVNNRDGDGTHKERWRCEGKGCPQCVDGWPGVFGNRFYMEMSPPQWALTIHDLHTRIQNSMCRCGGTIYVQYFKCEKCERMLVDVMSYCDKCRSDNVGLDVETGMAECGNCHNRWSANYQNSAIISAKTKEKIVCECGYSGKPKPHRFCSTEGCAVDPYTVFDCSLVLRSTGEKKNKRVIIDNSEICEPDARLFDPAYQGNDEWSDRIVEAHLKSLDLDYLLKAPQTHEQAALLRKPDPFANAGVSGQYAQYEGNEEPAVE